MDNLIKLIEALESGDYKQDNFWLRDSGKFNTAGVACHIYHKETGLGKWAVADPYEYYFTLDGVYYVDEMPEDVAFYFGFDDTDPEISNSPIGVVRLSEAEEIYGWTFETIAKSLRRIYDYYKEQKVDMEIDDIVKNRRHLGNYVKEHKGIYEAAILLSNAPVWIEEATNDPDNFFGLYTSELGDLSGFWQMVMGMAKFMELASSIKPNLYTNFTIPKKSNEEN